MCADGAASWAQQPPLKSGVRQLPLIALPHRPARPQLQPQPQLVHKPCSNRCALQRPAQSPHRCRPSPSRATPLALTAAPAAARQQAPPPPPGWPTRRGPAAPAPAPCRPRCCRRQTASLNAASSASGCGGAGAEHGHVCWRRRCSCRCCCRSPPLPPHFPLGAVPPCSPTTWRRRRSCSQRCCRSARSTTEVRPGGEQEQGAVSCGMVAAVAFHGLRLIPPISTLARRAGARVRVCLLPLRRHAAVSGPGLGRCVWSGRARRGGRRRARGGGCAQQQWGAAWCPVLASSAPSALRP